MNKKPRIKLEREVLEKSRIKYIEATKIYYRVSHVDKEQTFRDNVVAIFEVKYSELSEFSARLGLKENDLAAEIFRFYPNGSCPEKEDTRKGVGSYVLKRIIKDVKGLGAKVLYAYRPSSEMQNFLSNHHGFKEMMFNYYKILSEPSRASE